MEAGAPSPDSRAADLTQSLSKDSESETMQVPESGNRSGPAPSTGTANETSEPIYPNAPFVSSGYPTPYYYGGYGDQGVNLDGGMTHGVYGDPSSYIYHQGYGFTPYGVHPPGSSAPAMQHNGQLYGLQQYRYPCPYDQAQVFNDGSYAQNKYSVTQMEKPSSVTVNHASSSAVTNKGNMVNVVNGDGTQSPIPSNALLFSDMQSKQGARFGLPSPMVPVKDFSSQSNQNLALSFPQYAGARPSTAGLEPASGFMNRMYPSNKVYCQYGSAAYGPRGRRIASSESRGVGSGNWKKNMDGFNEMSKGPRATNSDNKSNDVDNKEVPLVPVKEQYNGEDLSENYSDAKFFVIKSYSEDDIHRSIKYSVWASTPNGNRKLNEAYEEAKEKPGGCPVFLLFSVNSSGQFVGLAEMVGPVDFERSVEYWQKDRWTGCFPVKWHIIKDIPNILLRKITLENNGNRPVTNSRDTQEVMFEKGIQILNHFKGHPRKTCMLDDFDFYERRENLIRERKSKERQSSGHVREIGDTITNETVKLRESVDGTLANQSVPTEDLASLSLESKASLLEEAEALEDSSELPN